MKRTASVSWLVLRATLEIRKEPAGLRRAVRLHAMAQGSRDRCLTRTQTPSKFLDLAGDRLKAAWSHAATAPVKTTGGKVKRPQTNGRIPAYNDGQS